MKGLEGAEPISNLPSESDGLARPQIVRDFTKKYSQGERDNLAIKLKGKRSAHRKEIADLILEAETSGAKALESREKIEILKEKIVSLKKELAFIQTDTKSRILNFFKIKKVKSELLNLELDIQTDEFNLSDEERQRDLAQSKFSDSDSCHAEDAQCKKELSQFYRDQEDSWAELPFTKEDIVENFKAENLAQMPLQDYVTLLRRFPGEMVTHVTRQGIRDHLGAVNHWAGMAKYWNGFTKILEDGKQRSMFGILLAEHGEEEAIAKFLGLNECSNKLEAVAKLDDMLAQGMNAHGSFADFTSVHFATEEIADQHYGAEKGNEIFFAYPSAMIASEYYFSGQLSKADGGYHNNQWVWSKEADGIDINAGLVFIPGGALVDKENGSRYNLDEKQEPSFNKALFEELKYVTENPEFKELCKDLLVHFEQGLSLTEVEELDQYKGAKKVLENKFGPNSQLIKAVFNYRFLSALISADTTEIGTDDEINFISSSMKDAGVFYELAHNPVSSREYWEKYFINNPSKKPSKIIYYDGDDPTKAFRSWKTKNRILNRASDFALGFSENSLDLTRTDNPLVGKGERFRSLAMDIIEKRFPQE